MACVLTTDLNIDCRDSMGGLRNIYVMEFANAETITVTAGVVTAIEKALGKKFWKYQLPRETGVLSSPINPDEKNGSLFFTHEVKIAINKLTSQIRNEILLLAKNRLLIVGEDMNGVYWLVGRQGGMMVSGGNGGSTGTAAGDRNGAELEFSGVEPENQIEVDAATAATLQTAGV